MARWSEGALPVVPVHAIVRHQGRERGQRPSARTRYFRPLVTTLQVLRACHRGPRGRPRQEPGTEDMHSLDRVNMAWDRQHPCNIGPGVIGACPRVE